MARPKGLPKTGGGSRKGVPNKINADVKAMILGALDALGGQQYLIEQASKNPASFMTLLGKVLPTQIQGDPDSPLQHSIKVIYVKPGRQDVAARPGFPVIDQQ
jgi:hypothetical protein